MKFRVPFLLLALLLAVPLLSFANACPTDTLANVIALGSCSIAGTTITFSPPAVGGEYYAGPYAGDTQLGPDATHVTFTPDADPTNPGFTLTGDFNVSGGYSCAYGSGLCGPYGNKENEQLAFFNVAAPTGQNIAGISAALTNGHASTDSTYNSALADLYLGADVYAYVAGDGTSTLSNHTDLSTPGNSLYGTINMHSWDYSGDTASSVGFDGASFHFNVAAITATPEPGSLLLLATGLTGLLIRRKRA